MSEKRKKHYISILIVVAGIFNWNDSIAQMTTPQEAFAEIYRSYDSLQYLSFDVKYTYTSDTLDGDFTYDVLEGSYTLAGKKAKFNIGDVEFMQNDSFFITVYNNDKFILVADPRNENSGKEMPMRQTLDEIVAKWGEYTSAITYTEDTALITLVRATAGAQFLKFTVSYDTTLKLLYSIEYTFEEPSANPSSFPPDPGGDPGGFPPDPGADPDTGLRKNRFKIEFLNYRFDNFSETVYDQHRYIFFEDGACKPVEKYNDFRIFYSRIGVSQ
jgi:hypothetical protein